jgi:hypothetical protein
MHHMPRTGIPSSWRRSEASRWVTDALPEAQIHDSSRCQGLVNDIIGGELERRQALPRLGMDSGSEEPREDGERAKRKTAWRPKREPRIPDQVQSLLFGPPNLAGQGRHWVLKHSVHTGPAPLRFCRPRLVIVVIRVGTLALDTEHETVKLRYPTPDAMILLCRHSVYPPQWPTSILLNPSCFPRSSARRFFQVAYLP